MEVLLKKNRRPLCLLLVVSLVLLVTGISLAGPLFGSWIWNVRAVVSVCLIVLGMVGALALIAKIIRPRISHAGGQVKFYLLERGKSIDVPLEIVEGAFLGQTPAPMPTPGHKETEMLNLVIRLSQKATDWAKREVDSTKGHWCDGYITIHGASCEPLGTDLAAKFNERLAFVKQENKNGH